MFGSNPAAYKTAIGPDPPARGGDELDGVDRVTEVDLGADDQLVGHQDKGVEGASVATMTGTPDVTISIVEGTAY